MYMKKTRITLISLCVCLLMSGCSSAHDDPKPEYLPKTGTSALTCSTEEPVIAISETKTSALSSMTTEDAITTEESRPETTYSETTEVQITNEPWYWCWTDYMDIVLDIDDIPSETVVTAELMSPTEKFTASTTGRTTASPPETAVSNTVSQETSDTTTKPHYTVPEETEPTTSDTVESSDAFIDDYTRKYYYNTLTESQKKYYRFCFGQKRYLISAKEPSIPESDKKIALFAMNRDNPHLQLYPTQYMIDNGFTSMTSQKRNRIQSVANSVAENARKYDRDFEKVKYIHDELCDLITFEYNCEMISAFLDGKSDCSGYADAFCMVCQLAEIDCIVVYGTANNGRDAGEHAWNKVKINNCWYNVDVSWDDVKHDRYTYFLCSDKSFSRNHTIDMPVCFPVSKEDYPVDYLGNETI